MSTRLTVKEASDYLGITLPSAYALIRHKKFSTAAVESLDGVHYKWTIDKDELSEYKRSKKRPGKGHHKVPEKIFISTPMSGKFDCEILDTIKQTAIEGAEAGVAPKDHYTSGYTTDNPPKKLKHPELWYLGRSIMKMAECDEVVFTEGWEKARGCVIERIVYDFYFKNYKEAMTPDILRGENDARLYERFKGDKK